jgi:hypothetical protein
MGRPRILEIQVRDSGIGMSGETLETVFDRFQGGQGDGGTDSAGGVHLGLNISRTLLEAQGGWLDITSELGIGTAVTVRLPQDRQTRTTLARLGLVERLLRRCRENRRLAEVYVFGKFSDDNWDDIAASWRERVSVNPLDDETEAALRIWTLTSEMAVGVLVDPPRDSVEHTLAPSFVVCEDNAYMFPSYAVGVALARRDGESSTRLIGVATSRMLRARELMARATIEAMDSGIEYITREWTEET